MRINRYVALITGLSRRAVDGALIAGRVQVNGKPAQLGQLVQAKDQVRLDGTPLGSVPTTTTIMLNKPAGYVASRQGQGSKTIYDLLPTELHSLKPVGRLDKESSGLLLLTNDGQLANQLTHPSFQKEKQYQIVLDKPLRTAARQQIMQGVPLADGLSRLQLKGAGTKWLVTLHEGRNRQIRRTFAQLGYTVIKLHRTHFGSYQLKELGSGKYLNL